MTCDRMEFSGDQKFVHSFEEVLAREHETLLLAGLLDSFLTPVGEEEFVWLDLVGFHVFSKRLNRTGWMAWDGVERNGGSQGSKDFVLRDSVFESFENAADKDFCEASSTDVLLRIKFRMTLYGKLTASHKPSV